MTDFVTHDCGPDAGKDSAQSSNVVTLRPRQGRGPTVPASTHRASAATDTRHRPVRGSFESTEMIWLKTPQHLPGAMLTVVFSTSGRSMIAHADSSYLWFDIAWEGDRLRVIGPVQRTDDATTALFSIALLWFERFLLACPRLTTDEHGITLSGPSSQVSFTAVRTPSKWCVVDRARLQC